MLDSSRTKQQILEKENVTFFALRIAFFFGGDGGGGGSIFEATYKAYLVDDKSKLLVDIILNFMESITVFLSLFLQYLSVLVLVLCVGFSCLC